MMEKPYSDDHLEHSSLQLLLNNNSFAIWLLGKDLNILSFNQLFGHWMRILYGIDISKGRNLLELFIPQPQAHAYWQTRFQKVFDSRSEYWFDDTFYLMGKPKTLRFRFFPVLENGYVKHITCFARESTAIEDANAYSATKFQSLIESAQDMIFALDEQFCFTAFNKQFQEILRHLFGAEVAMGRKLSQCAPAYFSMLEAGLHRALKGERHSEEQMFGKGLTSSHFETTYSPIKEAGLVKGVAVFSRDVTYRRKAERQANKGSQLLASINKNIKEALFRSTPDHSIKYVNKAFLDMFEYENREEVMPKKAFEFYMKPHELQLISETLLVQKSVTNVEIAFKRKNGSTFWGLLSSSLVEGEEGEIFFDGAIRDITSQKQAQRDLEEKNEELKKANQALDSFVYTASHDLKAPLASIGGLIKIFRMEKDDKRKEEYLSMMEKSVHRLENFIKDIVYYARNARTEVKPSPIALKPFLEEQLAELRYAKKEGSLHIQTEIREDAPLATDKSRLEAITRNLISNAINYADTGKERPFVKIEGEVTPDLLYICISDNGIGMEEIHLSRIFDMFYRISSGGAGSGLGLHIVKEALEKLGGRIEVTSKPNEGSVFKVYIPNTYQSLNQEEN